MKVKRNPVSKRGIIKRKPKVNILRQKMDLPGMDFFGKIIQGKTPIKEGMYIVFFDQCLADSKVKRQASMQIANFSGGKWALGWEVRAYMGPLPVLALPPLKEYTPGVLVNQFFYTGTLEDAAKGYYETGPHTCYILAYFKKPKPDHFIFCLDSDNPEPYVVSKYYFRKKDDRHLWKEVSEKAVKKYGKMMESLKDD